MTKVKAKKTSSNTLKAPPSEEVLIDRVLTTLSKVEGSFDKRTGQVMKRELKLLRQLSHQNAEKYKDLADRKRALRKFIDDFPSMLGYWDKNLVNTHSNKVYAEYFGKTPDKIRGIHIKELLGPKIFKMNRPFMKAVLKGSPQTFERVIPTPSGELKSTLATYVPHHIGGRVEGFFVTVTDITERKALEEKNQQMEAMLYEKSQLSAVGEMASGIAHEINNPLSIIYGNACKLTRQIKSSNFSPEKALAALGEIESTVLRIEKIVDGLRMMSRNISNDKIERCEIDQLIRTTLSICEQRFQRKRISLIYRPPSKPIHVMCRSVHISQILLNILNNAYDALKESKNPKVVILTEVKNNTCVIAISNNGPTIPKVERDKIFLPFFTTKKNLGTGLGLSISKGLANLNNGELKLAPSNRVKFELSLELAEAK